MLDVVTSVVNVPTRPSFTVVSVAGLLGEELLTELDGVKTDPVPVPAPVEPLVINVSVVATVDPLIIVVIIPTLEEVTCNVVDGKTTAPVPLPVLFVVLVV